MKNTTPRKILGESSYYHSVRPEEMDADLLKESFASTLKQLKKNGGDLDEDFDFITGWAKGDHGIYMDMMKAIAINFMPRDKRPTALIACVGSTMSGKTCYTALIRTILGPNNVTDYKLKEVLNSAGTASQRSQNYWYHADISRALANFSDENANQGWPKQDRLKDILDKNGDYKATFYALMPNLPIWDLAQTQGLSDRTIVLSFDNTFDTIETVDSFATRTFTPEVITKLLGQALALSKYYTETHGCMLFSVRSQRMRETVRYQAGTFADYMDIFLKYFCGYKSKRTIKNDYLNWCKICGLPPVDQLRVGKMLDNYNITYTKRNLNTKKGRISVPEGGTRISLWRFTGIGGKYSMVREEYIDEFNDTVLKLAYKKEGEHYVPVGSLVWMLDHYYRTNELPLPKH